MAVRVRYKLQVAISSSSAEEKDLGNALYEVYNDRQGEGGSWKVTVPANTNDVQINLTNVSDAKFILLRSSVKDPTQNPVALTIKRNAAEGEAFPVVPMQDTKEGIFMMTTTGLTSLFVTNAGSVAMDVTIFVAGD